VPRVVRAQEAVTLVTNCWFSNIGSWLGIMIPVTKVRAALLLSIVLMWVASPAIACVLPGATLTPAERECCHDMAEQCGQASMPASHSCCQTKSHHSDALPQPSASVPTRHLTFAVVAIQTAFVIPVASPAWLAVNLHSPPHHADSSAISILRI
jgi:hypothetical protein